jgi:hypothetical protein
MAQDATKNSPNLASNESFLDQVQNVSGRGKSQDGSFLAQVTGNPLFTAVSAILARSAVDRHH